jgi:hypothetical protein
MAAFDKKKAANQVPDNLRSDSIDSTYQKWITRQMDARFV